MNLQLTRPLVFFDLEGTGLDTQHDRIISLAMHKVIPHKKGTLSLSFLVNPGRPIPAESTAIHGITDADVQQSQPFSFYAEDVLDFLSDCDLAGFGCLRYDVPLLYNELQRADLSWNPDRLYIIDVGNIFKIKETRTLTAAVNFYCGTGFENAHEAMADARATKDVLHGQLARYDDLPTSVAELALFSNYGNRMVDVSGKFYRDAQDVIRFNFGPHKDEPALTYPEYLQWMYSRDFPADTDRIVRELLNLHQATQEDEDDDQDMGDWFQPPY